MDKGLPDFSFADELGIVSETVADDNAKWKQYRGGTAGDIIIDNKGNGQFQSLIPLKGNLISPYFFKDSIVFLSDHEGISNLYSVSLDGSNLQKLTNHSDYYVRSLAVHNTKAIYQSGGEIFVLDLDKHVSSPKKVSILLPSIRTQIGHKPVRRRASRWAFVHAD